MPLSHINLTVSDAGRAAEFLIRYFGMREMGRRGRNMIFLTDDNRMVLALMKGKDAVYPGNFHIGFIQPGRAAADAATSGPPRLHVLHRGTGRLYRRMPRLTVQGAFRDAGPLRLDHHSRRPREQSEECFA